MHVYAHGPWDADLVFVGEAPGADEEKRGLPFVGRAGQLLTRLCQQADIDRNKCLVTNLMQVRPPGNNFEHFLCKKEDLPDYVPDHFRIPVKSNPALYLKPEHWHEVERLHKETAHANVVVALGNIALWAMTGLTGISEYRGTVTEGLNGAKVLPTFHPASLLREWSNVVVTAKDLIKAAHEKAMPDIIRPERTIYIDPSVDDLSFIRSQVLKTDIISVDLEAPFKSNRRVLSCIGFAPDSTRAFVIPFYHPERLHYWSTLDEEIEALETVRAIQESNVAKVMQNGLYDVQVLWMLLGIRTFNWTEDTMIKHHALYPELPKSLGFMGSILTNEVAWKTMRPRGLSTEKSEE